MEDRTLGIDEQANNLRESLIRHVECIMRRYRISYDCLADVWQELRHEMGGTNNNMRNIEITGNAILAQISSFLYRLTASTNRIRNDLQHQEYPEHQFELTTPSLVTIKNTETRTKETGSEQHLADSTCSITSPTKTANIHLEGSNTTSVITVTNPEVTNPEVTANCTKPLLHDSFLSASTGSGPSLHDDNISVEHNTSRNTPTPDNDEFDKTFHTALENQRCEIEIPETKSVNADVDDEGLENLSVFPGLYLSMSMTETSSDNHELAQVRPDVNKFEDRIIPDAFDEEAVVMTGSDPISACVTIALDVSESLDQEPKDISLLKPNSLCADTEVDDLLSIANAEHRVNSLNSKVQTHSQGMESYYAEISEDEIALDFLAGTPGIRYEELKADFKSEVISEFLEDPDSNLINTIREAAEDKNSEPELPNLDEKNNVSKQDLSTTSEPITITFGSTIDENSCHEQISIKECSVLLTPINSHILEKLRMKWEASLVDSREIDISKSVAEEETLSELIEEDDGIQKDAVPGDCVVEVNSETVSGDKSPSSNNEFITAEFDKLEKRLEAMLKQYNEYVDGDFASIDKEMSSKKTLRKGKRRKESSLRLPTSKSTKNHTEKKNSVAEWLAENRILITGSGPSCPNQDDEEANKMDVNTNLVAEVSCSVDRIHIPNQSGSNAEMPFSVMKPLSSEPVNGGLDDDRSESDLTISLSSDSDMSLEEEDCNLKVQKQKQSSTRKSKRTRPKLDKVDVGLSTDERILIELVKRPSLTKKPCTIPVLDIASSDDDKQNLESNKSPVVYTIRDTESDTDISKGHKTEDEKNNEVKMECVKRRDTTTRTQRRKRKLSSTSSQPTTDLPSSSEEEMNQPSKKARLENDTLIPNNKCLPVDTDETLQKENNINSEIVTDKANSSVAYPCSGNGNESDIIICEESGQNSARHPIPEDISSPLEVLKESANVSNNSSLGVKHSQLSIVSVAAITSKGRRNIRDIKCDMESQEAKIERTFRKEAVKERHRLEALYKANEGKSLKFSEDPLIEVDKSIAWQLKEHQREGVLFCWTSCFVKVDLAKEPGSGCILSHCMGLGKTLQILAFLHTLLTHKILGVKSCLVLCPLNISSNWEVETKHWFKYVQQKVNFINFSFVKERSEKLKILRRFKEEGGIGVIHYDRLRTWTNSYNWKKIEKKKMKSKHQTPSSSAAAQQQEEYEQIPEAQNEKISKPDDQELIELANEVLLNPDILICDEGHILKNEDTILHQTISKIRTLRKIILTGTPMQNNLMEYYYMIQLVKPNVLGSKKQFCNQFVNPIENGQHMDSSLEDIRIAKRREFRLNKKTEGFVHRKYHELLQKFIPPKHEYAVFVNLTELQQNLYRKYILTIDERVKKERAEKQAKEKEKIEGLKTNDRANQVQRQREGLLNDYVVFQHLCCHPKLLYDRKKVALDKPKSKNHKKDEEEANFGDMSMSWFDSLIPLEDRARINEDYRLGAKLIALRAIIDATIEQRDKVLVFSKWRSTLDVIQKYIDVDAFGLGKLEFGKDYFRIDGSTTQDRRSKYCCKFNESKRAKLFLITTKAGGLGVNLHKANRVVIFDVSMNPSDDEQSIFRVYRLRQNKTCYVYRLVTRGGMEEIIYNRCLVKLSVAVRVVDDLQMARNVSIGNTIDIYTYNPASVPVGALDLDKEVEDLVLRNLLRNREVIASYLEHQTLLQDQAEEHLNDEEKESARNEVVHEETLPRGRPKGKHKRVKNTSEPELSNALFQCS